MTQIDELVKRARSVADHAFSGTPQFVAELADAIESQSAELTRLRDRNAELVKQFEAHDELLHQCLDERDSYKDRIAVLESAALGIIPADAVEGGYIKPKLGWTCFHCGDTFTTPGAAQDHFGCEPSNDPACKIKVGEERGLVMALRRAESRIASIEATVRELREALTTMRDAVQQWCDAVDRDSSWDGWDHHFKAVKWELLPATNAALAASESVGKSEGENDGVE